MEGTLWIPAAMTAHFLDGYSMYVTHMGNLLIQDYTMGHLKLKVGAKTAKHNGSIYSVFLFIYDSVASFTPILNWKLYKNYWIASRESLFFEKPLKSNFMKLTVNNLEMETYSHRTRFSTIDLTMISNEYYCTNSVVLWKLKVML